MTDQITQNFQNSKDQKSKTVLCPSLSPFFRPTMEDMLSADDVSCSSSQVSAKSEKNMADFDGEESGCEEELVQINSHAELSSHLQQHLPNLASIYHEHLVQGELHTATAPLYSRDQAWKFLF